MTRTTHQSLYLRYRPRSFSEVIGQDQTITPLRNAVVDGSVTHGYLFSGPRGTGKTSTARILAKAMNCSQVVDGEPCHECSDCITIEDGVGLDVLELDAASNNKVEDVRELLSEVGLASFGRTKVYILDEVHMLTPQASNALLKTLEEPPPDVIFVLATTDPDKVLPTIRSRVQNMAFGLLTSSMLEGHLSWIVKDAGIDIDARKISKAALQGNGSVRDAISALERQILEPDESKEHEIEEWDCSELLDAILGQNIEKVLVGLDDAMANGSTPQGILRSCITTSAEMMRLAATDGDYATLPIWVAIIESMTSSFSFLRTSTNSPATLMQIMAAAGSAVDSVLTSPVLDALDRLEECIDISGIVPDVEPIEEAMMIVPEGVEARWLPDAPSGGALYQRFRPKKFSQLVGQDHVANVLLPAIRRQHPAQAYLFGGSRGTGKTTTARLLARALNCLQPAPDGDSCLVCESCLAIDSGIATSIEEIDAASGGSVQDIRDLQAAMAIATTGKFRVVILDEVHMLSKVAAKQLLKIIERPMERTVFVLATTDVWKLPWELRNATQFLEFNLVDPDVLQTHVESVATDAMIELGEGASSYVVRLAAGSVRDALSALDRLVAAEGSDGRTSPLDGIMLGLITSSVGRTLSAVSEGVSFGKDPALLATEIGEALGQVFDLQMGLTLDGLTTTQVEDRKRWAKMSNPSFISDAITLIGHHIRSVKAAPVEARSILELTLVKIAKSQHSLTEVLARVEVLSSAHLDPGVEPSVELESNPEIIHPVVAAEPAEPEPVAAESIADPAAFDEGWSILTNAFPKLSESRPVPKRRRRRARVS